MIPPAAGFSLKRKERRREFKDSSQETAAEKLDWRTSAMGILKQK